MNTFWCRVGPGAQVTRGICRRDLPREIEDNSPATAALTISRHHVSCPRSKLSHAVNPVLNRGDRRELIFLDDEDRQRFLATLGEVCAKTAVDLPQKSTKGTKTLMTFPSLRLAKNKR